MKIQDTNDPASLAPASLALTALGWTLSDDARAERLLSLTGLTPEDLRTGLGEPATLAAILAFLEAHEPDLVACADAIGATPAALVEARRRLERA
ncbi:MAG TPA: DUF3572 family protein [Allosphingosinicella sp.]|jgi:hypothetical protein